MNTPFEKMKADERTVYIKPVDVADLPDDVQEQALGAALVYAVHNAEGERLALVKDEKMAFVLARQNDFAPVHVH